MTDLICRNTMTRCQTPGMCAPHGGCKVSILVNANVRYSNSTAPLTTPDTIELFPGVQFRKDTTKPLGNQWLFLHEGHWLIAKLAYCDDISMDHLAKVMRERDALAPDAGRYRWMRDCPWVGHMQAVGITALGDDTKWLSGIDADRAIDAAMAPAAQPDPGDDLLVVVIPGTEVMTPIAQPWKEIAEPVADADRQCHVPDCYNCEGTGRDPLNNGICTTNDNFPF